jgi:PEP-CTERM motif
VSSLLDVPYAVGAVDWLDGELDFIVHQSEGGQSWKLRALIAPGTQSVHVVNEAVAVPEPASLALVAVALLVLTVSGRRRVSPSKDCTKQ